jgi:hypothetical protein
MDTSGLEAGLHFGWIQRLYKSTGIIKPFVQAGRPRTKKVGAENKD